jgi:hypothetical protein
VDTIIQAAAAAGVDWARVDVCTYRNNLNKLLLTQGGSKDGWSLHCCHWAATDTLFLDIVPGPPATYPNADKFTYYGYKLEAVCTGVDALASLWPPGARCCHAPRLPGAAMHTRTCGPLRAATHTCAACAGEQHVDATSEFASVVQYRLGRHSMLMAAEVDAQAAAKAGGHAAANGRHYVEMKTYM